MSDTLPGWLRCGVRPSSHQRPQTCPHPRPVPKRGARLAHTDNTAATTRPRRNRVGGGGSRSRSRSTGAAVRLAGTELPGGYSLSPVGSVFKLQITGKVRETFADTPGGCERMEEVSSPRPTVMPGDVYTPCPRAPRQGQL
ncbi:Hypothetical protein SMAX5B_015511 [Scophthalmus maximus]|uniref:Uncharacterized protein n=1 Tax=Scophthalmus maximus TaxID=52904 RepID=A0A2U9CXF2_SCOMX|nr:Hypothetical protein SMAX5B_015511 [Scophthalmus maximus]